MVKTTNQIRIVFLGMTAVIFARYIAVGSYAVLCWSREAALLEVPWGGSHGMTCGQLGEKPWIFQIEISGYIESEHCDVLKNLVKFDVLSVFFLNSFRAGRQVD